jgi:hypothetical protein
MLSLLAHAADYGTQYSDKIVYGPDVAVNWAAIAAATAAAMVIGSLWYGPLFGKRWMKLIKLNKKDAGKNWKKPMLAMLVLSLLQAVVLAHFIAYAQYYYLETSTLTIGILAGFWIWAGFVLPVIGGSYLFARKPLELIKIDLGNYFVTLIAMGAIIAAISY